MLTLNQNKIVSKIANDFLNGNHKAVNLFDYVISFVSSSKTDYKQREILINKLNKSIHNQKTFFFHIASHYYLNTHNGEKQMEQLNQDDIIDDYYRQINEIIQSVKENSPIGRDRDKIDELIKHYLPNGDTGESESKPMRVSDIKLLVCTHGELGNRFWDEVDMAFIELQKFYGFDLEIMRFGENAENQASFLNELADKEDLGYNALCSTVLTPEIGDVLRKLSLRIPTVTYNTSVSSIPDAIQYVGSGSSGEQEHGYKLAVGMGNYLLKSLGDESNMSFHDITNDSSIQEEFIDKLNSLTNLLVISYSQDVDNSAFTDRHNGVTRVFKNAIYYRDLDELKSKVAEHMSLHEGKTPMLLGMCLQESVLDSLNDFLEQQTSLTYFLGVTDVTSDTLKRVNNSSYLAAVSGFPPVGQGTLVSASILNKVYGIFGGDVSTLKLYTPIGNADVNAEETALTVKEED